VRTLKDEEYDTETKEAYATQLKEMIRECDRKESELFDKKVYQVILEEEIVKVESLQMEIFYQLAEIDKHMRVFVEERLA